MRVGNMLESANCFMVSQPSTEYMFDAGHGQRNCYPGLILYVACSCDRAYTLEPDGAMLVWETGAAGNVIEPGSVKLSDDKKISVSEHRRLSAATL